MRIFLAMAMAASLFVAAGCACATGDCNPCEVVDDCATCVEVVAAPACETPACETPVIAYAPPAPVIEYAPPAPVIVEAPVVVAAPAPVAVAPVTCNPCAGL